MNHAAGQRDRALRTLREHPDNPRTIEPARLEQLKRNLADDPGMLKARPIIALPDGTVIAGNMRLRAARDLGWTTIPVYTVELDDETARLWMLRDNAAFGEWESEGLAAMLASLDDVDLELTGLDPSELDALLGANGGGRTKPPEPGSLPTRPRSKVGEVYELGAHRLICGNAGDAEAVQELLAGDFVGCVVTDPPYGIEREGIPNDDPAGLRELYRDVAAAMPVKDAVVAAFQSPRLVVEWLDVVREAGHKFERLLWLYRRAAKTYPWRGWVLASDAIVLSSVGDPRWPEARDFVHDTYTKLELEDAELTGSHSTIKPSWVVRDLVAKLPGGDVYDPFGGSGTTLIAAEQLGRRAFLMEIDPGYCDVIRDRWERWQAQDAEAA